MSILRDNCSSSRATGTRATQLVDPPSLCQEGVRGRHRHQRQRHRHHHHRQDHDPCCRKSQIICQEGEILTSVILIIMWPVPVTVFSFHYFIDQHS